METMELRRKRPHLSMTMDPDVLARLEDYRYENRIPSRTAAIEQLVIKGLEAAEAS